MLIELETLRAHAGLYYQANATALSETNELLSETNEWLAR